MLPARRRPLSRISPRAHKAVKRKDCVSERQAAALRWRGQASPAVRSQRLWQRAGKYGRRGNGSAGRIFAVDYVATLVELLIDVRKGDVQVRHRARRWQARKGGVGQNQHIIYSAAAHTRRISERLANVVRGVEGLIIAGTTRAYQGPAVWQYKVAEAGRCENGPPEFLPASVPER